MGKIFEEYMQAKQYQACVTKTIENLWDKVHKYEEIEQILNDWKEMGYSEDDGLYSLISKVVEDGNNKI